MVVITIPPTESLRVAQLPYKLPKKLTALLDFYKWAVSNKRTSSVFIIDGRSGLGKTTLGGQIGLYCDPNFNLDNYYFTPEQFLEALEKSKKGDFLLFDEAMLISSRNALTEINKMIIIAMSMIRSKEIFVCFCVNSVFDLDRNLALSRADLLLNVYGANLIDRGKFMAFFKAGDGRDRLKELYLRGKKFYDYSHPKSNFNCFFSKYFVVNEEDYEYKKQEGIIDFLSSSRSKLSNRDKDSRDKLICWVYKNNKMSHKELALISGLSPKTIFNVLRANRGKDEKDSSN